MLQKIYRALPISNGKKLVSENLSDEFGKIYLEIIFQDHLSRTSCFRRVSDDEVLSYHIVEFGEEGIKALGKDHTEVIDGGYIGEVIKKSRVKYERVVSETSSTALNFGLSFLFGTKMPCCNTERINYKIKSVSYAEIHEFYNPKYMPPISQMATYALPADAPGWFLIAPWGHEYETEYPKAAILAGNRDTKMFVAADGRSFIGHIALDMRARSAKKSEDNVQEIFVADRKDKGKIRNALLEYAHRCKLQ